MANGNMKFSVVLEAVTQAFNTAMNQAKGTYTAATASVRKDSADLSAATQQASVDLSKVFKATDAAGTTAALKQVTAELNSTAKGATFTAEQLKQIGTASKQSINELNGTLRTAQAELKALAATKATPQDIEAAKNKVTALKVEVSAAQAEYGRFQTAASTAMKRAGADTQDAAEKAKAAGRAIYDSLNIKTGGALRQEIAQITRELQQFKNSAGAPAQEVNRVTQAAQARIAALKNELKGVSPPAESAAGSIRGMGSSLLGLAGVTAGLAGVAAGMKAIVDTTIQFQAVNKQLEYAVGSAKQAAIEFQFVKETANSLGLDLLGAAEGYAKLAAATKGTTLEGKATRDIFLGVSQAAATMGLSVADTNGVFLALSQIAGKGKVSMEELRGQLGERLAPAMKIAADSMGVTVQRLNQLVENGLDAEEFLAAFAPALKKAFAADAAKNAETLQGRINQLRNEFKLFLNDLGEGGVASGAATIFKDLTDAVGQVREALKTMDPTTVEAVKAAFDQLYGAVREVFSTLFSAISDASDVLDSMRALVSGVVGAFAGFDTAGEQVGFLTRVLQGVSILLGSISDGVYAIRIAFTAVTGVVQEFFANIALGLSKVTFGQVSKELEDLAFRLNDAGQKSFSKAGELAEQFKSQTVAAMDRAVQASEQAANKASAAHVAGAEKSAAAQGKVGEAAAAAGVQVATAAQGAVRELQFIGDKAQLVGTTVAAAGTQGAAGLDAIGNAATLAKQKIEVFAGAGGTAIINTANAVNEVKKAFTDLAKDVGVQLPAAANSVTELGLAMGTVAAKSKETAASIAKELPDAVAKLNAVQLTEFKNSFIGGLEKAGASAEYVKARIIDLAAASAKSLGIDLGNSLKGLTQQFQDAEKALLALAADFDKLKAAGVDASKLLADGLTAMLAKAKNPVEVQELIKLWQQLGNEGKITGKALADGLDQAKAKLDELKPGIIDLAAASAKSLGIDLGNSLKGLTQQFQDAEKALLALAADFDKLKAAGVDASKLLADGLTAMLAKAKNPVEVQELIKLWQQLGNEGKITGKALADGLDQAKAKLDELKPGINSVAEAFKTFGLQTREEATKLANNYREAFNVIESSGQATTAQLQQAFAKYAEAAIAANGGVSNSYLDAKAAALGMQIQVDEAGKVTVEAMGKATASTQNLAAGFRSVGDAAVEASEKATAALERQVAAQEKAIEVAKRQQALENQRRGVDDQGFSADKSGNRVVAGNELGTRTGIINFLKNAGVDDMEAAKRIANEFADSQGNIPYFNNPGQKKYNADTLSMAVLKAAESYIYGEGSSSSSSSGSRTSPSSGSSGASSSKTTSSSSGGGSSKTVDVNFTLGGQSVQGKIAASDETAFLGILQRAKGVS